MRLIIGNKNYSSWSLRAWLALKESGVPFEEERIPLFEGEWKQRILQVSGAGRVPVLMLSESEGGPLRIHDTAAILDFLAENIASAPQWPDEPEARYWARSISAEMHSGFYGLRGELPLNVRARFPTDFAQLSDEARTDVDRVRELWVESRVRFGSGGPWLLGERSVVDFVYAPVVLRFLTYGIGIPEEAAPYAEHLLTLESMKQWIRDASSEREQMPFIDQIGAQRSARKTAPILPGRLANRFQQRFGPPAEAVEKRVLDHLDESAQEFVSRSPFVVVASADADGRCDASPRGGHPGFVEIVDRRRLRIPDRFGNRRFQTLHHVDQNPSVGLLFLVPGEQRAWRVNGRCHIEPVAQGSGPESRRAADAVGPPCDRDEPAFCLEVDVEECFPHCAKSFRIADLWLGSDAATTPAADPVELENEADVPYSKNVSGADVD